MSNDLNKISSRIKYYLLDYKDENMEEYLYKFGTKRLNDLTLKEIHKYFIFATNKDIGKVNNLLKL